MSLQTIKNKVEQSDYDKVQAQVDSQYKNFMESYAAADEATQQSMLADLTNETGLGAKAYQTMFDQMKQGNDPSKVLMDGLGINLPIWLREQMDNTKVPNFYNQLNEFIPFKRVENGTMTMDYQDYLQGDSKNPFYGSQYANKDKQTWLDLTLSKGEKVYLETYMADHGFHIQAMTYKKIFTNAHKSEVYFTLQFNNLLKKIGQPRLDFYLAVRAKYLASPETVSTDIVDGNDSIAINATTYAGASVNITGENMYSLISQLNVYLRNREIPSREHLTGKDKDLMDIKDNTGKAVATLKRSLSLDRALILAPNEFMEAYDKGIMAGAFQGEAAAIANQVKKNIRPKNYDILFGAEYGNVSGMNHSLIATGKDTVSGSADLILVVPTTLNIINQYDSENSFDLPNNTTAINFWDNWGTMEHKYEDLFYVRINLTAKAAETPSK